MKRSRACEDLVALESRWPAKTPRATYSTSLPTNSSRHNKRCRVDDLLPMDDSAFDSALQFSFELVDPENGALDDLLCRPMARRRTISGASSSNSTLNSNVLSQQLQSQVSDIERLLAPTATLSFPELDAPETPESQIVRATARFARETRYLDPLEKCQGPAQLIQAQFYLLSLNSKV